MSASRPILSPYPYFGGKGRIAPTLWRYLGDPSNYCEPFFGSGAVLLARQRWEGRTETVNELSPFISNFWRAVQHDPEAVVRYVDYPVIETDVHARHRWLLAQQDFRERMLADPDYYDAKVAGWWVWGLCAWIGHGWCDIETLRVDGETAVKIPHLGDAGRG